MERGRSDGGGIGEAFVSTWIVTLSNYLHSFHSAAATALRSTQRLWANYVCRCVQVKSNSYHMFSINMLVQCNLCQSICCERQGQGRNQLQRWRVEAIFALSSKSSSLSLFALATSFSLSPPLSFFLSFIPGLSHTTTQTAASSHLLTDGRGRRRRRLRLRGGLLRYEQLRDGPHSGFNTAYSVHTPTC